MLEGYVVVVKLIISIPQKYIDWKVMEVVVGCEGDYGCSCMLIDTFSGCPLQTSGFGISLWTPTAEATALLREPDAEKKGGRVELLKGIKLSMIEKFHVIFKAQQMSFPFTCWVFKCQIGTTQLSGSFG